MDGLPEDLRQKAQEWLSLDKNPDTRSEIESLVEARDTAELTLRLASRMTFGTAGLRSKMGAGFSRMNDLTVIQTTQGLCKYLELQFGKEVCQERGVVVGYDARHNSHKFSRYVANVFINEGMKVYLFSRETPTPFTPFALRRYSCVAGVMVTASHNPKQDNGYKVYWSNGAQIIPPHDKGISQCINDNLTPWPTSWEISNITRNPLIIDPYSDIKDGYLLAIQKYCYRKQENSQSPVTCVYTAMHGVGYPFVKMAFEAFGLPEMIPVEEQVKPDPEFPTVVYPNPEEGKSALDLSISTADSFGQSVIIANDPDADRLALAEKQPGNTNEGGRGNWRVFTGNEIGSMLGWWAMENFKKNNENFDGSKVHLICSTVSSKLLRSIAKVEGIQFSETLTGFKWMGNLSHTLIERGEEVLFAFEEAIGFMFGTTVLDKDGVSAAAVAGEMAAYLYSNGQTFSSLLEDIYLKYGRVVSSNSYFICHSKETIKELFDSLRKDGQYPSTCGTAAVTSVCDITVGYDSTRPPHYKPVLPVDPGSQMIMFCLDTNCEFTLRASGTEPKIKYYVYMFSPPGVHVDESSLKDTLSRTVDDIINEFIKPNYYNLIYRSI